jgi:hypothetical protein
MNKLSKEKRTQLILVALLTLGAMAGLWFCLISYQQGRLKVAARQITDTQKEIEKTQRVVREASQIDAELGTTAGKLAAIELDMPSGDLYSWFISRFKQFNVPSYHVDIPQLSQPVVGEVKILSGFPYNQATVSIAGSAFYWDLGKFLADFENRFPYARIQNLALEAANAAGGPEDREKLSFRMEMVILLKPSNP